MIERLSPRPGSARRTASRSAPPSRRIRAPKNLPPPPPSYVASDTVTDDEVTDDEATILGFPAEFGEDGIETGAADVEPGADDVEPVVEDTATVEIAVARCPDRIGCILLVLAGVAANVTLSLPWLHGGSNGLTLVSHGVDLLGDGVGALARSDLWQPLTVVAGGGLLILLGLALLVPAHSHRLVGFLALVVALGTAAAVLVLLAGASWRFDQFGVGTWFAAAVPVLGLLGALKAMLTPPHVTLVPR